MPLSIRSSEISDIWYIGRSIGGVQEIKGIRAEEVFPPPRKHR